MCDRVYVTLCVRPCVCDCMCDRVCLTVCHTCHTQMLDIVGGLLLGVLFGELREETTRMKGIPTTQQQQQQQHQKSQEERQNGLHRSS